MITVILKIYKYVQMGLDSTKYKINIKTFIKYNKIIILICI